MRVPPMIYDVYYFKDSYHVIRTTAYEARTVAVCTTSQAAAAAVRLLSSGNDVSHL